MAASFSVFADQPSSDLDEKPSLETAANAGVQVPSVPSDQSAPEARSSYLYDLKQLIEKSRANIKEVNEKIREQAILKRNQKREEKAREYYEKGVGLIKEGKLDEAEDYFEKAIRITNHPEMVRYIRESEQRLRRQEKAIQAQEREHYREIKLGEKARKEDIEQAYKDGLDLYNQRQYRPAKDTFVHIEQISPNYRATRKYLKIINKQIIAADLETVKQQTIEVERQQKEAEEARAREKAKWLKDIEMREREHKEKVNQEAASVYERALKLYKEKKFAEAKKKFEEVSWVIPNYRDTMRYLSRIDKDAQEEQERQAIEQKKLLQEQLWQEEVERKKQEARKQEELKIRERQHQLDLQEQAQFLYKAAVVLYDKKSMNEALEKFTDIEKTCPDFKSTRLYLARIKQWQYEQLRRKYEAEIKPVYFSALEHFRNHELQKSKEDFLKVDDKIPGYKSTQKYLVKIDQMEEEAKKAQIEQLLQEQREAAKKKLSTPAGFKHNPAEFFKANSIIGDQKKQTQEIVDLAKKSALLYRKISDLANDDSTEVAKQKMAKVDTILNNLKDDKERLLHHMTEEEWAAEQEDIKSKEEARRSYIEKLYKKGVDSLSARDYVSAKADFLELQSLAPGFRSTKTYLNDIEAVQTHEFSRLSAESKKREWEFLEVSKRKQKEEEIQRIQQEKEEQRILERRQQEFLKEIAQKASDLNDEIIQLSYKHDYEAMKAKFTELQVTVNALTTLKAAMAAQKESQYRDIVVGHEAVNNQNEIAKVENKEEQKISVNKKESDQEIPALSSVQLIKVDRLRRKQIMQEKNGMLKEGIDLYQNKKYLQAKLLFSDLAGMHDNRAEAWLKKTDKALAQEIIKSQEMQERERTSFLADQVKAQRELVVFQERERLRQKQLAEELERQKSLLEDNRLLQLRKEEALKAQAKERELQEEKKAKLDKEIEKRDEQFRFHKIKIVETKPQTVVPPVTVEKPHVISSQEERKRVEAEIRQKIKEEKQREKEHQEANEKVKNEEIIKEKEEEKARTEALNVQQLKHREEIENLARIKREQILRDKQEAQEHEVALKIQELKHREELRNLERMKMEQKQREKQDAEQRRQALKTQEIKHREEVRAQAKLRREQREKEKQEAREKRKALREQELKHREELRAQERMRIEQIRKDKEEDRERRMAIKAQEMKQKEEIAFQERIREEQKQKERQEELDRLQQINRQRQEEREERLTQEKIVHEETLRREELERQEQNGQAELEARRQAVRRQLEEGVEAMYQEAMGLYKQGDYMAAAEKFKDVHDVIPGYKKTEQYIEDSRQKSLAVPSTEFNTSVSPSNSVSTTATSASPASTPVSHQDAVAKALDLFDPNAK